MVKHTKENASKLQDQCAKLLAEKYKVLQEVKNLRRKEKYWYFFLQELADISIDDMSSTCFLT